MLREGRHLKFDRKHKYEAKRVKEFRLVEMRIEVASLGEQERLASIRCSSRKKRNDTKKCGCCRCSNHGKLFGLTFRQLSDHRPDKVRELMEENVDCLSCWLVFHVFACRESRVVRCFGISLERSQLENVASMNTLDYCTSSGVNRIVADARAATPALGMDVQPCLDRCSWSARA